MSDVELSISEGITPGGCRLQRYRSAAPPRGVVVLAHGMFSNHRSMQGLARHLARAGWDSWSFDFSGHGTSRAAPAGADFESVCLADVRDVLDAVQEATGVASVNWVGHSGGGLAILMHLVSSPADQVRVARIALLASQATDACSGLGGRARVALIAAALRMFRRASGPRFGLGPEDETREVLGQWCRWNLSGRWRGRGGIDYLARMATIDRPTLAVAAAGDDFIAPPPGCRRLHEALGSSTRRFVLCGKAGGFQEDYSHARIVHSRAAEREVWPLVAGWLDGDSPRTADGEIGERVARREAAPHESREW